MAFFSVGKGVEIWYTMLGVIIETRHHPRQRGRAHRRAGGDLDSGATFHDSGAISADAEIALGDYFAWI